MSPGMKARKARPADAPAIHALIAHYAAQGLLLPRSEENVREHLGCFLLLEDEGRVAGCVALEPYGAELAEIRSLALEPDARGRGLGARLLRYALAIAKRRNITRVFAVTHAPEFFARQGFTLSARQALPEKIARDCRACPKAAHCQLVAVVATVCPARVSLPVVASPAKSLAAV